MSTWGEGNSLIQDIYPVNEILPLGFDSSAQPEQFMWVDVGGRYGRKTIALKRACPGLASSCKTCRIRFKRLPEKACRTGSPIESSAGSRKHLAGTLAINIDPRSLSVNHLPCIKNLPSNKSQGHILSLSPCNRIHRPNDEFLAYRAYSAYVPYSKAPSRPLIPGAGKVRWAGRSISNRNHQITSKGVAGR